MRASDLACKLAAAWRTRMAAQADSANAAIAAVKTADAAGRSNVEPRLCYDELRQWLEEARKLGEVPGTIKGSRVLVNFFGGKRKNMTLGFPTDLSKIELSEGFRTNFLGPM